MKNKLSFLVAVMTLSVIFNLLTQSSSRAEEWMGCLKTADGSAIRVTAQAKMFAFAGTSTFNQDQCSQEPDEYLIKFYKVALCRDDPYKGAADPDFSSCADIFKSTIGKEITLKPETETNLLEGDLLLPVGTFPYLVVMVNNHLKIKHKQKYVDHSDGTSAVTIKGNSSGGGQWCWTIAAVTTYANRIADGSGKNYPASYNTAHGVTLVESGADATKARLKCGTSEPAAGDMAFATEIIDNLADEPDTEEFGRKFDYYDAELETGVTGIEMAQNLIQDDNRSIATNGNNAKRLLSHFKYSSPVVISDSTVGFKLRFSTYSAVSIDMAHDGTDMWGAKVGADPFMVQVQTKVKRSRGAWR